MPKPKQVRFLVDESVEYRIVEFLRISGFDVAAITEVYPSMPDLRVLNLAYRTRRVLITNDKGFGKLIFEKNRKSNGVVLMRMPYASTAYKIVRLNKTLKNRIFDLPSLFVTIRERRSRSRKLPVNRKIN